MKIQPFHGKILAGLLAVILSGCAATAAAPTQPEQPEQPEIPVQLEKAEQPEPDDRPLSDLKVGVAGKDIKIACIILAKQLGYYEEEGLNVTFETISNLSEGLTAVDMGKLDILPFGVIPSATFVSQGADVVVIGGTISEGSEIVVLPENKGTVQTLEDFRGKRIGCYRMETGHMVTKGLLREAGFDLEKDVEFVLLDSQQTIIEAVRKGEVDMGFLNSGQGYVAQQSGLVVEKRVGELAADFPCCRQTTSRAVLSDRRDDLVRFQTANLRAYESYLSDQETVIRELAAYSGQPEEYVQAVLYGLPGEYESAMIVSLDPNRNKVEAFYKVMEANEDISAGKDMSGHIDSGIYAEALEILLEREPGNATFQGLRDEYAANND